MLGLVGGIYQDVWKEYFPVAVSHDPSNRPAPRKNEKGSSQIGKINSFSLKFYDSNVKNSLDERRNIGSIRDTLSAMSEGYPGLKFMPYPPLDLSEFYDRKAVWSDLHDLGVIEDDITLEFPLFGARKIDSSYIAFGIVFKHPEITVEKLSSKTPVRFGLIFTPPDADIFPEDRYFEEINRRYVEIGEPITFRQFKITLLQVNIDSAILNIETRKVIPKDLAPDLEDPRQDAYKPQIGQGSTKENFE